MVLGLPNGPFGNLVIVHLDRYSLSETSPSSTESSEGGLVCKMGAEQSRVVVSSQKHDQERKRLSI